MASRISKKNAEKEIAKLEGFVPVEGDIKHAIEIPVKSMQVEKIEKLGERKIIRKPRTRRTKIEKKGKNLINKIINKNSRIIKVGNKKIELGKVKVRAIKTGGHILIITEKPQAAAKIADALGEARKYNDEGVPYYELERDGEKIIIAAAVGHLFTVNQKPGETGFPIFELEWIPSYLKKAEFSKKYYFTLLRFCKDAKEFIVASVDHNEMTPILENGEFKILKIGEVIDSIIKGNRNKKDFKVPAFDSDGKIEFRDLKKAIRHQINESLYELSLEYARKVKLTSSHNVFILKNNKIEKVKTSNLKKGDKILCPAFLPSPQEYKKDINLLELIRYDKKKDIYISGEDVAQILKRKVINLKRKNMYLNDERAILTIKGRSKIRTLRNNLGCSTSIMGRKARVCQSSIVQWENGVKNPSLTNFKRYLMALNLNPKEFIENKKYCTIIESSFSHLLLNIYKNQFKNFSNLDRATIPLYSLNEEDIKNLEEGFIYGSKNKRNKLPIRIPITKELVRLMGYYLAEGDINNNYRIRFSLGLQGYGHEQSIINEIKKFCSLYDINCHYYLHNKIRHQIITIDNSVLALLFKKIFAFGEGAKNKRLPSLIFNLPAELKKEFLRAYFLGDGSIFNSGISFNTSSENLASDVSYLLLQLGIISSTYKVKNSGKSDFPSWHISVTNSFDLNKIKEVWQGHHLSSKLKVSKKSIKKRNLSYFGDLSTIKIKDIREVKSSNKYVYDFSVEGENFISGNGGVCCHNTDYDIEGEVIGLNIVRFIAEKPDAERMKFSSLTKDELVKAFETRSKSLDWGLAIAGETRHYLDWMYGINLSRALMAAIKAAGAFRIMSIGRVQGPALNLIVEKELAIKAFKPEPYWSIFVKVQDILLKYIKDIVDKKELDKFKDLKGKTGVAETKTTEESIMPPAPFDLTTLQTEAYKFYGINPGQTLKIAQQLYLAGIISYPRTSSQKIPLAINARNILKKLGGYEKLVSFATRKIPVEGSKSDSAHPSIHPTGEQGKLTGEQAKVYDLIVRRFISCFCEDALVKNKKISFVVDNLLFIAKGLEIEKKGWIEVYKTKLKESELKTLAGQYKVEQVKIDEKMTQPPNRYTPASLVRELEKKSLGTKSTRSSIIETLYNRGYVKGQSIEATELGISLIETLKKHSPLIIDEKLTRQFEKEIESIQVSKKGLKEKEEKVLKEAKEAIIKIAEKFKKEDKAIGKELLEASSKYVEAMKKENELMLCPVCKKGKLAINYSKKTRRNFVACNAYPECKTTFSLPPNGSIRKTDKTCEKCGYPMLIRLSKAKRPWIFCFNPECETNKEWAKKKK